MVVRVFGACIVALALYLVGRLAWKKRTLPLPPGPPGWPFIGNLLEFPSYAPYKTFGAMSAIYGPIVSFKVLGTRYIVLNSLKASVDLFEKKSALTGDRPHLTMACELIGWDNTVVFLPRGDKHRKHRKFFHQQIGTKSSLQSFHHSEQEEIKQFLRNTLKNPDDLLVECHRMACSVILKISHGYNVEGKGDPLVEMAGMAMGNFAEVTTPGRFLVDVLPFLRYFPDWFPGCGFLRYAKQWRKRLSETAEKPHMFVLNHLEKGDAAPSFTARLLQEGVTPEEEEIVKWASFSMYLGGSETTSSTLSAFFLAITIYPEVLKKAQAEIDAVIGHERLPTMEDREALPYVNAICSELLRWSAVTTLAMRVSAQDIIYEGYIIPKGSWLTANIWFILSDPKVYPEPDVFDPERFLGENKQPDPREACFGWGTRSCAGAHLADSMIFTCVAMSLATLDVSRCIEGGVEWVPKYDLKEGSIRRVKPFKCKIAPRSGKAEELLQARS